MWFQVTEEQTCQTFTLPGTAEALNHKEVNFRAMSISPTHTYSDIEHAVLNTLSRVENIRDVVIQYERLSRLRVRRTLKQTWEEAQLDNDIDDITVLATCLEWQGTDAVSGYQSSAQTNINTQCIVRKWREVMQSHSTSISVSLLCIARCATTHSRLFLSRWCVLLQIDAYKLVHVFEWCFVW